MKFPSPPLFRLLAALIAIASLAPALRAADDETGSSTARVKFSDPSKPGTLRLALPWAEVHVTGTDQDEITVTSSLDRKGRSEVDSEGFRRLDEDVTFELVEKNNVAMITVAGDNPWASQGSEFEIKVPRNTNLIIRTEMGGEIEVDGVEGDLDINSMNGEVTLRDIASSAVVNTLNGEISARFKHPPVKPVSLSTMNGEIDVHLPPDTKANLRMRTHNSSIRTNFPEGVLQAKSERNTRMPAEGRSGDDPRESVREIAREAARLGKEQARMAREIARATSESVQMSVDASVNADVNVNIDGMPVPPVPPTPPMPNFGGKSIVGTLNGGGVDIKLTSMNGTITLRQSK
ncbi:MAG TPA: hypothetical protein VHN79_06260 [Lacunisphaera sp.]|nr:hypothetical protein [Lacunisphaera sp.]